MEELGPTSTSTTSPLFATPHHPKQVHYQSTMEYEDFESNEDTAEEADANFQTGEEHGSDGSDEDDGADDEEDGADDEDDGGDDDHIDIKSKEEILEIGLLSSGFSEERLARNNLDRRIEWFQTSFGCSPIVVEKMWTDLQTTDIEAARIGGGDITISIYDFLNTLEFLKCYQPEKKREGHTGLSSKTLRKRCWFYFQKLQALKEAKIIWPQYPLDTIWVMSVDGIHFAINEPKHPEFSQDKKYFSHKKQRAGYAYELGICLFSSNLIWMSGPHKAGQNDKTIFAKPGGLKEALAEHGIMAIGDKFYNGHPNEMSCYNAYDSDEVKLFKRRALLRQESFNSLLKQYAILEGRFRHAGREKFEIAFEAIAVICQYRIERECPLWEI